MPFPYTLLMAAVSAGLFFIIKAAYSNSNQYEQRSSGMSFRERREETRPTRTEGQGRNKSLGGRRIDNTCSICLENVPKNILTAINLTCGHVFHTDCIKHWVNCSIARNQQVICPNCRTRVTV